jgi:hypothetical protein
MSSHRPRRPRSLFSLLFVAAACSTTAEREAMVPVDLTIGVQHPASVATTITRGSDVDADTIVDADFLWAVEQAIAKAQVFRAVVPGKDADCLLAVHVAKLTQPSMGANLTVRITTRWTLTTTDGRPLADEVVESSYTAKWGEAFAGMTRLRLATEGAARTNIADGLSRLGRLASIAGASKSP